MERSTGANTIPNLFGAGKDGFGDGVGPPPTELNASWFNNTQEELCRAIEDQGFAVGGTLDQLTVALNSWQWSGSPSIKSGGKLSILSGGAFEIQSGGMGEVLSGGTFQVLLGGIAAFSGTTLITPTASLTCDTLADFTKDMLIGDDIADTLIITSTTTVQSPMFVNDDISMAGATAIFGGAGSSCTFPLIDASSGVLRTILTEWTNAAGAPSTDLGEVQFDGYRLSLGDGTTDQAVYAPFEKYIASASTGLALTDIVNLSVTLTIPKDREVLIELVANQKVTVAGNIPKLEIRAVNSGGADPIAQLNGAAADAAISPLPATVTNNDRRPNSITIKWKPANDVPLPANDLWTIQAEHGVNGSTLTSTNCNLRVTYK